MSTSPITTKPFVFPEQPTSPRYSPSSSAYGQSSISTSTQAPIIPQVKELDAPKYDESRLRQYWSIDKAIKTSQKAAPEDAKATKASIMQAFQTLSPEVQEQFYKAFENHSFHFKTHISVSEYGKIDFLKSWFATAIEKEFNGNMWRFANGLINRELSFFLQELKLLNRGKNALEAVLVSLMRLPEFTRKIVLENFFSLEEKNIELILQDSEKIVEALKQAKLGDSKIFQEGAGGGGYFLSAAYLELLKGMEDNIVKDQAVEEVATSSAGTEKTITHSRKALLNLHGVEVSHWTELYWASTLEDKMERLVAMQSCFHKLPENMQKELIAPYQQRFGVNKEDAQAIACGELTTVNSSATHLIFQQMRMDFIRQDFIEIAQRRDGKNLADVVDLLMNLPEPMQKAVLSTVFGLKSSDIEQIFHDRAKLTQTLTRALMLTGVYIDGQYVSCYSGRYFTTADGRSSSFAQAPVDIFLKYPWEKPMFCSEQFVKYLDNWVIDLDDNTLDKKNCSVIPLR